jgi:phosphoserine phosphatase RsbX
VIDVGIAERALYGGRSGDRAVVAEVDGGGILLVAIDGLGHGPPAADAAETAARVLVGRSGEPLEALFAHCHRALHKTRGAVMTAARVDPDGALEWAGVGNVEARLVRGDAAYGARHDSALVLGGVVGYNLPAVRPTITDLRTGDAVAFATDGIDADYSASLTPGLTAQRLAERIMERHARTTDDALAAVVRYVGR